MTMKHAMSGASWWVQGNPMQNQAIWSKRNTQASAVIVLLGFIALTVSGRQKKHCLKCIWPFTVFVWFTQNMQAEWEDTVAPPCVVTQSGRLIQLFDYEIIKY